MINYSFIDILLIRRYYLYLAFLKAQNKIEHTATLVSTRLIIWLIMELFIVSVHFPPSWSNPILQIPAMQEFDIDFQYKIKKIKDMT